MNFWFEISNGLMMLFTLAAFLVGLFRLRISVLHRILFLYAGLALFQDLFPVIVYVLKIHEPQKQQYIVASINVFSLLEGLLFYYYFHKTLKSPRASRFLLPGILLLVLSAGYIWILKGQFFVHYKLFITTELFLLLIPSLLYILELSANLKRKNVYSDPGFWTGAGIFLFSTSSIPLFLGWNFSSTNLEGMGALYSVNNILYVILFSSLILSLLCKPQPRI